MSRAPPYSSDRSRASATANDGRSSGSAARMSARRRAAAAAAAPLRSTPAPSGRRASRALLVLFKEAAVLGHVPPEVADGGQILGHGPVALHEWEAALLAVLRAAEGHEHARVAVLATYK